MVDKPCSALPLTWHCLEVYALSIQKAVALTQIQKWCPCMVLGGTKKNIYKKMVLQISLVGKGLNEGMFHNASVAHRLLFSFVASHVCM